MCVLEEERTHRDPTEAELTRTAKRLAANLDNEKTFKRRGAVAMELKGDSKVVTNWMRGVSSTNNRAYQQQVGRSIDALDEACEVSSFVTPSWGYNLWEHFQREGNSRTDTLTWGLRDQPGTNRKHLNYSCFDPQNETLIAIRGAYDGGVSSSGAGGGWWLDGHSYFVNCVGVQWKRRDADHHARHPGVGDAQNVFSTSLLLLRFPKSIGMAWRP